MSLDPCAVVLGAPFPVVFWHQVWWRRLSSRCWQLRSTGRPVEHVGGPVVSVSAKVWRLQKASQAYKLTSAEQELWGHRSRRDNAVPSKLCFKAAAVMLQFLSMWRAICVFILLASWMRAINIWHYLQNLIWMRSIIVQGFWMLIVALLHLQHGEQLILAKMRSDDGDRPGSWS